MFLGEHTYLDKDSVVCSVGMGQVRVLYFFIFEAKMPIFSKKMTKLPSRVGQKGLRTGGVKFWVDFDQTHP